MQISYMNNNCFHCYSSIKQRYMANKYMAKLCLIIFSTSPELTGHIRTKYLALIRTSSWLIPAGNLLIHTLNLYNQYVYWLSTTNSRIYNRAIRDTPPDPAPANTSQNDQLKADRNSKWA